MTEPTLPLREIPTACEMERLGVGICQRRRDEIEEYDYSIDASLRRIKYPWALSAIFSSHGSYGYLAVIDRGTPSNMASRPKNVASVMGTGNTVPQAIAECIKQIDVIDAELIAALKTDPNDY